jgi:palmitoyltransferase ZDHHC13/17
MQPSIDNPVSNQIIENFEQEQYADIPNIEEICTTCQIKRPNRSKHCKFLNNCVLEYDHYCYFLSKTIGKGNRKVFVLGLSVHYMVSALFLYLTWVKLNQSIDAFDHISTYTVNLCLKYWELDGFYKTMVGICIIVTWYSWWYFFIEIFSVSCALTVNEVMNRHRYRYLYTPFLALDDTVKMQYKNPFTKGIFHNWIEFLIN